MKKVKIASIWLALLALGVWYLRWQEPPPPVCPPELAQVPGVRLLYRLECGRCHRVQGLPGLDVGTLGPPLDGVGKRAGREYLRQSLHDPGRIVVKGYLNVMPRYDRLTPAEERELLDYLESLRN